MAESLKPYREIGKCRHCKMVIERKIIPRVDQKPFKTAWLHSYNKLEKCAVTKANPGRGKVYKR